MSEIQIVEMDDGSINARLLAKEIKADFRRVEAASIKIPVRFISAEGKRFFLRWFNSLQLNIHFISVIARTRLEHADVEAVEAMVRESMEEVSRNLNKSLDGAEELFKMHGISSQASYDTVSLELHAGVMSSLGRRFLDVLCKFDQMMPLLQTLEIHEIISPKGLDIERAGLKGEIRQLAISTRRLAMGLQRRMNLGSTFVSMVDQGIHSKLSEIEPDIDQHGEEEQSISQPHKSSIALDGDAPSSGGHDLADGLSVHSSAIDLEGGKD